MGSDIYTNNISCIWVKTHHHQHTKQQQHSQQDPPHRGAFYGIGRDVYTTSRSISFPTESDQDLFFPPFTSSFLSALCAF